MSIYSWLRCEWIRSPPPHGAPNGWSFGVDLRDWRRSRIRKPPDGGGPQRVRGITCRLSGGRRHSGQLGSGGRGTVVRQESAQRAFVGMHGLAAVRRRRLDVRDGTPRPCQRAIRVAKQDRQREDELHRSPGQRECAQPASPGTHGHYSNPTPKSQATLAAPALAGHYV